jgi:hypothetical protein
MRSDAALPKEAPGIVAIAIVVANLSSESSPPWRIQLLLRLLLLLPRTHPAARQRPSPCRKGDRPFWSETTTTPTVTFPWRRP